MGYIFRILICRYYVGWLFSFNALTLLASNKPVLHVANTSLPGYNMEREKTWSEKQLLKQRWCDGCGIGNRLLVDRSDREV